MDTQIELHTDRNQQLAKLEDSADTDNGQSVLRGIVTPDHRTTDRLVVVNLPGFAKCAFKLRLPAEPAPAPSGPGISPIVSRSRSGKRMRARTMPTRSVIACFKQRSSGQV